MLKATLNKAVFRITMSLCVSGMVSFSVNLATGFTFQKWFYAWKIAFVVSLFGGILIEPFVKKITSLAVNKIMPNS